MQALPWGQLWVRIKVGHSNVGVVSLSPAVHHNCRANTLGLLPTVRTIHVS